MHITSDMLTLVPHNGGTSVAPSPSTLSPALNGLSAGQYNPFTFGGIPATNLSCLQNGLNGLNGINGLSLNGLQAAFSGYALTGLPAACNIPTNGIAVSNISPGSVTATPTSSCTVAGCTTGSVGGITINGVTMAPPTALTAPEVYGLPSSAIPASKSSSTSDSPSSGESSPAPLSPAQSMELVWHGEFDRLFSQYFPHMWCLVPTFYPPGDSWRTFKDSAKVRFSCQDCGHGWTSMKGRVIFWFELNYATNAGCVMFKLYGQQCQKCKTGKFEHAMWYPEEVVKVIGNVYNRVGQIYYGFVRPPLRIDRRVGKPRNQHNSELCQACKEGLCKEEWSFT
ncbi:uncharacterized protein LOC132726567 isoform X1 [Ruditapes philippinarum]|uniref:uncharacterized protein LOC132726567 isoform X1 n=1 Tax=Ruditapes philippinarum TaxID=129788 RepID=UPI00295A8CE2|nr:uncharacterized protein LOC132726567 isoform X1 [Ruditapes philippinarum]